MDLNLPFKRSYWVIPRKFLAGYYPGDLDAEENPANLERLVARGIRLIVNLMADFEADHTGRIYPPYDEHLAQVSKKCGVLIECVRTPIADLSVPSRDEMRHILDIIDRSISRTVPVYVHCLGGLGRTGTVVGCFLARHGIANGQSVLTNIKALRKADALGHQLSPQTVGQQRFVCSWKTGE